MGGAPPAPKRPPTPAPPAAPLPPPAPPSETDATSIITEEQRRTRRRFGVRQSILTGPSVGLDGNRPLGT